MDPIEVSFPGGKQVAAQVGNHLITTDQPEAMGGTDAAPAPYDLFLASLATCAGIYVLGFLQARELSAEGLRITQHVEFDPITHLASRVRLEVHVPAHIPSKYRSAILRAAEGCKVKKTMAHPPELEVLGRFAVDAA
jgi:ribosomal protein S12 methylthiotransferase accessory factor